MSEALIGAGCFWGIEEYYRKVNGVILTKVGYSGGITEFPTYEQVCTGTTEHAEVVKISYDKNVINYSEMLELFWACHDPTQLNRQGPDVGRQYRSVIYYYSGIQKEIALESKKLIQDKTERKIVTEIVKAKEFYMAEDYHQLFIYNKSLI